MEGLLLFVDEDKKLLIAKVEPLLLQHDVSLKTITGLIKDADNDKKSAKNILLSGFSLLPANINKLNDDIAHAKLHNDARIIEKTIGEPKEPNIQIIIASDNMSASMAITQYFPKPLLQPRALIENAKQQGVKKGLSHKRIRSLIKALDTTALGQEISVVIAQGLPPKNGKNSYIKPLVPNAFERILRPQGNSLNSKVDMRNLGDILCVEKSTPVARRIAPTMGRSGTNVLGESLPALPGQWNDIELGENTSLAENDENLILANIPGLAKFDNGVMSIDNTFVADKGVNVGTGNIKFTGAVIVMGDVMENMEIIATGDITINGFVESAYIRAGGDIVITQGATGKMHDEDCQLIAGGNIYLEHAQGLDIIAGKDLNVGKQLAHSRVTTDGKVTIGSPKQPMGNLFACTIKCGKPVEAGSIGAVSGSPLSVDFSEGYLKVCNKYDALMSLFKQLTNNNSHHEHRVAFTKHTHVPQHLTRKLLALNDELVAERALLQWLKVALEQAQKNKQSYETNAKVIANKELFPGVSVKLNHKVWRGTKEYKKCHIVLADGNWKCLER